ncbi:MAG: DNA-binding protein [Nitrospirae bacterium]|nr:DNA-binding protein [Nitrospirota bacterium]
MIRKITILAMVLVLGLATIASAQPWRGWKGSGGWGCGGPYQRMYDPQTVATVTGTVEAVETFTSMRGMSVGVHLTLKTADGTISAHLGPAWYIERQDVKLEKGDAVEVKGSKITFDSNPAIIAAEVKKGDEVLKLRDENGIPNWAGSGMGRMAR